MKRNGNVTDDTHSAMKKNKSGETILEFNRGSKIALAKYYTNFLSKDEADELYTELYGLKDEYFTRDLVSTPRGKVKAPRFTAAFGEKGIKYGYAGFERVTITKWPMLMLKCKKNIEQQLGCVLNYGFVNIYDVIDEEGDPVNHYIGWHSDSEGDIVTTQSGETTICSISLGDERKFQLRERYTPKKDNPTPITSKVLEHGSLCTMEKHTQLLCKHQVPKKKKASKPRINITFRNMKKN